MLKNITKNFTALIISQFIYKIFSFFAIAYAARQIGDVKFGQLSFAMYLGILFFALADMGLSEIYILEVAGNRLKEAKAMGICMGNRAIFSIFAFAVLIVCCLLFGSGTGLSFLILSVGISMIIDSATFFLRSVFRAREWMEYEAISIACEGALKLSVLIIALKLLGPNLFFLGIAFLVISAAVFIITIFICKKSFLFVKPIFEIDSFFSFLKRGVPFAVIGFLSVVSLKIDIIMLAKMSTDSVTGQYSAAVRLVEAILIIPITSAMVLFPVVTRLYGKSLKDFLHVYRASLALFALAGVCIVFIVYASSALLVKLIFGQAFLSSIYILKVLSPIIVPLFLRLFMERTAIVIGRTNILFLVYVVGVALKIGFNILFIPVLTYRGAAYTTIFIEFVICAFIFIRLNSLLGKCDVQVAPKSLIDNIAMLHERE